MSCQTSGTEIIPHIELLMPMQPGKYLLHAGNQILKYSVPIVYQEK